MDQEALKQSVLSVVRHILTTAGGSLVTGGVITTNDLALAVGALVTIAGIVWGVVEKQVRA